MEAHNILVNHQIMSLLQLFDPVLVGTFPLDIAIEGSDLDIICFWQDKDAFNATLKKEFCQKEGFRIQEKRINGTPSVIAKFMINNIPLEVFGQHIPTASQMAYRHLIKEYEILSSFGAEFKQKIMELKRKGHKTEPAFAALLGIEGDPYVGLLEYKVG